MSKNKDNQNLLSILILMLMGFSFILFGLLVFFTKNNMIEQLSGGFIIIPGTLLLFYGFRDLRRYQSGIVVIKHDERSAKNRLKASDLGFRFYFASLSILILLNSLKVIDEIAFIALTGPIIAVGIILYYFGYYWFERN
ncbi:MAG: hypothetical protein ACW964_12080 [Candidatus Hodarchaeales archaeon]|jgi:uncharacterized membrane protein